MENISPDFGDSLDFDHYPTGFANITIDMLVIDMSAETRLLNLNKVVLILGSDYRDMVVLHTITLQGTLHVIRMPVNTNVAQFLNLKSMVLKRIVLSRCSISKAQFLALVTKPTVEDVAAEVCYVLPKIHLSELLNATKHLKRAHFDIPSLRIPSDYQQHPLLEWNLTNRLELFKIFRLNNKFSVDDCTKFLEKNAAKDSYFNFNFTNKSLNEHIEFQTEMKRRIEEAREKEPNKEEGLAAVSQVFCPFLNF